MTIFYLPLAFWTVSDPRYSSEDEIDMTQSLWTINDMFRTGTWSFATITCIVGLGTYAVVVAIPHPTAHKDIITALVYYSSMKRVHKEEQGGKSMQSDESEAFPSASWVKNRSTLKRVEVELGDKPQAQQHSKKTGLVSKLWRRNKGRNVKDDDIAASA